MVRGGAGGGQPAPTPPHPTPAPLPVVPATTAFPLAADHMVRILQSRLGGLCGVMGGGSPPQGRVPARRLPPLAPDGSALAGCRCALLWACRVVTRRLRTPSKSRGLLPTPLPHASCGCLVWFSHPLALLPLSCPLPAWSHTSCRIPLPLPLVVGGEGCLGRG